MRKGVPVALLILIILLPLLAVSCIPVESVNSSTTGLPTTHYTGAAKEVKVFGTPDWHWCTVVKEFLDRNGIPYQYYDVSTDQAALKEMLSYSNRNAVPQILIDGQIIIGYNEKLLRQKLGLPAY